MNASQQTLDLIESLRAKGQPFCVATIIRTADSTSARAGAKALVTPDGDLHGFIGGGCVTGAVRRAALEVLRTGEPRMVRIKPTDQVAAPTDVDGVQLHKSNCPSGGTVEIFLEPMAAARTLLICGASPIAQAIVRFAADLGYRVTVAALAEDHAKIPGASSYLDVFDVARFALTPADAAIVATQGKRDRDALRAVLLSDAGYKGMVCSRRKLAKLSGDLIAEDRDLEGALASLHAPAGLPIGAIEPEEIALAVVGEIVAHRRGTASARPVSIDGPRKVG
ncbi:MAG: XdhC family protein [Inquilinaceae bacterium]